MKRFNNFIEKINFKRVLIIWLLCSVIAGILCSSIAVFTFRHKIQFAYNFHSISKEFKKSENSNSLISNLDKLSKETSDIVDILYIDNSNRIIHSTNNTRLAWEQDINLNYLNDKKYIKSNENNNVLFHLISDDKLMVASIFADNDKKIEHEYENDFFSEKDYSNKKIYNLSYTLNKETGNRIYFITDVKEVKGGELVLIVTATIAAFSLAFYWVIVALFVYQNALKCRLNVALWGIVTLCTNLIGVLVYTIYKQNNITCNTCGASQSKSHLYCNYCGAKIAENCPQCNSLVGKKDLFCTKCGFNLHNN